MKTNPDDPVPYNMTDADGNIHGGLTKREYFASLAMQGIISNISGVADTRLCSKLAIQLADDLIEQLNKETILKRKK